MQNSPAIQVKGISKKYSINHQQGGYIALRDVIANIFKNPFTFLKTKTKEVLGIETKEEFWALKNVNFDIMKGEVIGIIGRNGAGKSTLLKILSQITPPTTGEIKINGTVGSLLEVGTGFHPELTGRENIFLNGAILGMKKKDIVKKFDEIVKFADIEKFLDTPVKHYSSGMYVRLAFSVAAHMETDILIIDEVLAVGDAEFQKKCLGKMNDITKEEGRTILFVSHNMGAVKQLCDKVIILKDGKMEFVGQSKKGIDIYLNTGLSLLSERKWVNLMSAPGDNLTKISRVFSHKENGKLADIFDITKKIGITFEYEVFENGHSFTHGLNVYNEDGINVFNSHDINGSEKRNKGKYSSTVWITENLLSEGTFSIGVAILKQNPFILHAHAQNILSFKVIDNLDGKSSRGQYVGGFSGIVRPLLKWDNEKI